MNNYNYRNNALEHSGHKGMHWGVRQWQYEDGSLTPAGREHYGVGPPRQPGGKHLAKQYKKSLNKLEKGLAVAESERERARVRMARASVKGKEKRYNKNEDTYKFYSGHAKELRSQINSTLNKAKSEGFEVSSKDVVRYAQQGRNNARALLGGSLGMIVLGSIDRKRYGDVGAGIVAGKKWNVVRNFKIPETPDDVKPKDTADSIDETPTEAGQKHYGRKELKALAKEHKDLERRRKEEAKKQPPVNEEEQKKLKAQSKTLEKLYKEDKKYKELADKMDKAENDYLNIAEDDFTRHDEKYMEEYHAAEARLNEAKKEFRSYRDKALVRQAYKDASEEFSQYLSDADSGKVKWDEALADQMEKAMLEAEEAYRKSKNS